MSKRDSNRWQEQDRAVLWHPFTQHGLWAHEAFPVIEKGRGAMLYDVDGKAYLDGISSLWLNVHGHRRQEIDQAIRDQLDKVAHSTFLGLSHPPGINLARKLITLAPQGLVRAFYSDNGSTAMEIALKMAYQYWCQSDPPQPKRKVFVSFANAYHGDTVGSVSIGGIDLFHAVYRPLLFETIKSPAPYCRRCALSRRPQECIETIGCLLVLEEILETRGESVAAVVLEPRVQGAAGMIVQPPGFVKKVRELCDRFSVLLIADEVAVGFGRTGDMFACGGEGVCPDIMAVGKGVTGGYLPLAATLTTERIFEAFLGPTHGARTFFHGHSYTANPLACAAALASLEIFEREQTLLRVEKLSRLLSRLLEPIKGHDNVGEVRQCGLMAGIELEQDPRLREPYDPLRMMGRNVALRARSKGLIIRPLGDVVVLMPPFCVSNEQLETMVSITAEAIEEVTARA